MTYEELIDRFAILGYTKKAAREIVKDFTSIIEDVLAEGDSINLHGFGEFSVRETAPKSMVDLQTGERRVVPKHRCPRFIPSNRLRRICRVREEEV